jgi:hypothetical protein
LRSGVAFSHDDARQPAHGVLHANVHRLRQPRKCCATTPCVKGPAFEQTGAQSLRQPLFKVIEPSLASFFFG